MYELPVMGQERCGWSVAWLKPCPEVKAFLVCIFTHVKLKQQNPGVSEESASGSRSCFHLLCHGEMVSFLEGQAVVHVIGGGRNDLTNECLFGIFPFL